jgi:hypothetical protein
MFRWLVRRLVERKLDKIAEQIVKRQISEFDKKYEVEDVVINGKWYQTIKNRENSQD